MVCEARAGPAHSATTSPPCFSFKLQRFFERVGVGLVDFEAEIVLLNPAAAGVDAELRVARGDLLDGDQDFHGWRITRCIA